ncbi:MAG: hypothetical protein A3C53_02020 [Omnitrophica WOR_2 bacterium RIFCSPHIGHO2_02_FULL_68_15]|nr:MAG: hypothetical protein A3C53_02020 [Omnitrophica WOR_2 bacterium RIFCSPHIGHO2_02_FULL_68_15]
MSSGQDNQLETGLANQGGRLTGSSKFKQQSAVGDAFSSHRLGGSRFRIFPGFLGGDSSSTVVPVNALDLTVLYAKTDAFGQTITPAEWQTDRDPLFIWAPPIAADNVAGYSYAIDGAPDDIADTVATSFNVATATPNTLADGKHTFSVKAIGTGGIAGTPLSLEVWADTTPPQVVGREPQPGALFNAPPAVTATISDAHSGVSVATVTVLVNGTAGSVTFDAQTGTATAAGGNWHEGSNSIELRASDAVGNLQTPVVWSVVLDLAPPTGTITINGGAVMTTSAFVTLSLTGADDISGLAHLLVSNDELTGYVQEPFVTLRELWKLTPVRGIQSVFVKFVDRAGNASAPVSDAIELALLSPETVITSGPAGFTPDQGATFAVMCPEGGCVFSYAFDAAPWSEWSPAAIATADGLAFGNHYFRVKAAKDVDGTPGIQPDEEDPSPAERTWIVGVEPSVFVIPRGPHIKLWRLE